MGQTRIHIYVVMLPLLHPFSPLSSRYLPLMKTKLSKKYFVKKIPHRPAQTERGFHWFKTSFWLPDNFTTNSYCLIPKKGEMSYRRRGMSNKQSNKTLYYSSASIEHLKRQTTMQHLLQVFPPKKQFDGCMAKYGHDRFVSRILLYQRY